MQWQIRKRLMRLPADQIGRIENLVIKKSGCSISTYDRVINEKSHNLKVLLALAEVLNCTLNDIINPEYPFVDPQLFEQIQEKNNTLKSIGLTKFKLNPK